MRKRKKLKKLCTDDTSKQLVDERFSGHTNLFTFFTDLQYFCGDFSPDILNLINLLTLAPSSVHVSKTSNISTNFDILSNERLLTKLTKVLMSFFRREMSGLTVQLCIIIDMKENLSALINLPSQHFSKDEISLLSKGLKFVAVPKHINKAEIKEEIEVYGTKLRLMRRFRNDHREFDVNPFKKRSKFIPNWDSAIEMYMGCLEEEILSLDEKKSDSNLTCFIFAR